MNRFGMFVVILAILGLAFGNQAFGQSPSGVEGATVYTFGYDYCQNFTALSARYHYAYTGGTFINTPSGDEFLAIREIYGGPIVFYLGAGSQQSGTVTLSSGQRYQLYTNRGYAYPTHVCSITEATLKPYSSPQDPWGLNALPTELTLSAYPNPFNPTTTIGFDLPELALVTLSVFDISGRQVAELANGWLDAGHHEVEFNGSGLASGTYFAELSANGQNDIQRLNLVK